MTEGNRLVIQAFVEDVLIHGHLEKMDEHINQGLYTEHNPRVGDNLSELCDTLSPSTDSRFSIKYEQCHRLLAEGDFVLSVCEGYINQNQSSFFDLYRLQDGKIVEHWDTTEIIPSRSEWKNNNGKF